MTTKRIDELKIGDIVKFSSSKEPKIVCNIKLVEDKKYRKLKFESVPGEHIYYDDISVIYLGNNKNKENDMTIQSFEHRGFVLVPKFSPSGRVLAAICEEIDFSMYSLDTSPWITYSSVIETFKKKVDEIMSNKVPTTDPEKELNRLKLLLFMQPTVFYGTNQVHELFTLCENLLEASKKKEPKTKRVKQLVVGDIVIFPYCKGHSTIDLIKKIDGEPLQYGISTKEVNSLGVYFGDEEVVYLHNENNNAK